MKFIIGVVTFAATQFQLYNLALAEPQFDKVDELTPQASVAEIEVLEPSTKTQLQIHNTTLQLPAVFTKTKA